MVYVPFDRATGLFDRPVEVQTIARTGHLGNDRRHYDVLPGDRFLSVLDSQTAGFGPSTSTSLVLNWFEELRRMGGTNQGNGRIPVAF